MDAIGVAMPTYIILREFSFAVAPTAPKDGTSLRNLALTPISLGRKRMPLKILYKKAIKFLLFGSRGDFKEHLNPVRVAQPLMFPLGLRG